MMGYREHKINVMDKSSGWVRDIIDKLNDDKIYFVYDYDHIVIGNKIRYRYQDLIFKHKIDMITAKMKYL